MRVEHEFSMRELQESSRRLREDCAHQVELERSKVRQLDEDLARQQQQVSVSAIQCSQSNECCNRKKPVVGLGSPPAQVL